MMSDSLSIQLRRLSRADAKSFRAIRLEALERHPAAFAASFKEESSHSLTFFEDRLDKNVVLGAEYQNRLVGIAGFQVQGSEKLRHRGVLWAMYVREEMRGHGIAQRLVEGILDHARQHVEEVALSVWAENAAAIACYKSAGFVVTGQDPRALKIGDAYFDDLLMRLRFTS